MSKIKLFEFNQLKMNNVYGTFNRILNVRLFRSRKLIVVVIFCILLYLCWKSNPYVEEFDKYTPMMTTEECNSKCCISYVKSKAYNDSKNYIDDRINQIEYKIMSELHVQHTLTKIPLGKKTKLFSNSYLSCLKPGTLIFVDIPVLEAFTTNILPLITVPFVLISGDSDDSVPYILKETGVQDIPERKVSIENVLLDRNSKILHWYSQNCAFSPDSPRFTCIPIGLSQWNNQMKDVQEASDRGLSHKNDKIQKKYLAAVAFQIGSNPKERQPAFDHLCLNNTFALCQDMKKDEFIKILAESKFVISPHGVGLDCYRTWESLLLGAYVVVKTSHLDSIYSGLPVLIVQKWQDITKELLENTFQKFQKMKFQYEKLYNKYWYKQFQSHRKNSYIRYEYSLAH